MATIFWGVGLLKISSDADTSTTPRESCFCDGQNMFTVVASDLAKEETTYAVILAEESA